jgi:hypothetical protein
MTQKVDPSVSNRDLEKIMERSEQIGSVPPERTIRKPEAYRKPNVIIRPKDNNP